MGEDRAEVLEPEGKMEVGETPEQMALAWLESAVGYYRRELESLVGKDELQDHYTLQIADYERVLSKLREPENEASAGWRSEVIAQCAAKEKEREEYKKDGREDPIASQVKMLKPRVPAGMT